VDVAALLLDDGSLSAFDPATAELLWRTDAVGLPAPPLTQKPGTGGAIVTVPEATGFVPRDALTGAPVGEAAAVEDLPRRGRATTVGPVVVHQLPDRIVVYR
jgi:hypothetical protein